MKKALAIILVAVLVLATAGCSAIIDNLADHNEPIEVELDHEVTQDGVTVYVYGFSYDKGTEFEDGTYMYIEIQNDSGDEIEINKRDCYIIQNGNTYDYDKKVDNGIDTEYLMENKMEDGGYQDALLGFDLIEDPDEPMELTLDIYINSVGERVLFSFKLEP